MLGKKQTTITIGDFNMSSNNFLRLIEFGKAKEIEKILSQLDFIERNTLLQASIENKLSDSLLNISLHFKATGLHKMVQKYLVEFGK